jgi:hypothetical protein
MANNQSEKPAAAKEQLQDRFLTRKEAAEVLGLSPTTLAAWRSAGKEFGPPMRKHGGRAMYSQRELIAWSEQQRV